MSHKHKLKIAKWVNGILTHNESYHESYEEAIEESKRHSGIVKIFNELNLLVYHINHNNIHESYA